MKQRIEYIDLAKGICILLVIVDHISIRNLFGVPKYPGWEMFIQMRMPLYFILSGLFFKDYAGGVAEFVLRKFNRILIPFLFFAPLLIGFSAAVLALTGYNLGRLWSPEWFLVCLFEMNLLFITCYTLTNRYFQRPLIRDIVLMVLVFVVGTIGYNVCLIPWYFGTAMTCLPFLWIGYVLNRRISFFQWKIKWWVSLILGIVMIGALHFTFTGPLLFYRNGYYIPLPQIYATGTMGTIGVLLLARVFKHIPVLSYIGRYSIIVLIMHLVFVNSFRPLLKALHIFAPWSGIVDLILCVACCVPTCWLFKKYIPWFCAQKDLVPLEWLDVVKNYINERKNRVH